MDEHHLILTALRQVLRNQHYLLYQARQLREQLDAHVKQQDPPEKVKGNSLTSGTYDWLRKATAELYERMKSIC